MAAQDDGTGGRVLRRQLPQAGGVVPTAGGPPNGGGGVSTARDHPVVVRTDGHSLDPTLVATQDDGSGGRVLRRQLPQAGGVIITAGDQPVVVRADGHGVDLFLVAGQATSTGVCQRLPQDIFGGRNAWLTGPRSSIQCLDGQEQAALRKLLEHSLRCQVARDGDTGLMFGLLALGLGCLLRGKRFSRAGGSKVFVCQCVSLSRTAHIYLSGSGMGLSFGCRFCINCFRLAGFGKLFVCQCIGLSRTAHHHFGFGCRS